MKMIPVHDNYPVEHPTNDSLKTLIKPWVGQVERMGEMRTAHKFWLENLKLRDHTEELGTDGKTILKWY